MFENQLGLRENPFVSGHQAKYVYPSKEHQEALAHLRYGIENREPFVLITGEVGTGKTTAIYDALAEWGSLALVALITNSALTRSELIEEICLRFGVGLASGATKPQALVQLERYLQAVRGRGEMAILLLDEAQNLDDGLLEEIRLLSNQEVAGEKLLQIFLVGQPELEMKLSRQELRQLRQRIAIHYRLHPLSDMETERYIHHRVSVAGGNANELFPTDTCRVIHRLTNGIPREINTVAGQALLNAFVDDSRSVRPAHVKAMAAETEFHSVLGSGTSPSSSSAPPSAARVVPPSPRPIAPARPLSPAASAPASPVARSAPSPQPVARPAANPSPVAKPVASPSPVRGAPPTSPPRVVPPPMPKEEDTPRWAPLENDKRVEDAVGDAFTPGPAVEETVDETEASSLPPAPALVSSHAAARAPEPAPPLPPEREAEFADDEEEVGEMIDPELDELAAMSAPHPVHADEHESIEEPVQGAELDEAAEPEYDEESPGREAEPPRVVPSPHFPGGRHAAEETPPPDFELPETEGSFALPSWLDDLATKNAAVPAASASEPDVAPEPPPPPPPAAPVKPVTPVARAVTAAPIASRTAAPARPVEPVAPRPAPLQLDRVPPPRIVPHPGRLVPADSGRAPNFVGGDSLPPRLRDKLADREERAPKRSGWIGWVALLVVLAAVAFGVIWFGPWSRKPQPAQPRPIAPAVTTPVETPTTSTAASNEPTPAPEAAPPTPNPSLASNPVTSKPVATKTTKAAKPKHTATKSPAVAMGPPAPPTFGIVVGTFLDQERANEESASLSSKSSLPAHVQSVTEDGTGVFRVVLGRFDDRAKAEQVASDLVGRGLINEARVTTLGPR